MADANSPMTSNLDKYSNLPSNSIKTKAEKELEEKERSTKIKYTNGDESDGKREVQRITSSTKRRKPLGERLKETFFSDESDSVGDYILKDILIPSVKELVSDAVTGAVNILLFGDSGSRRSGRKKVINGSTFRDYCTTSSVSHKNESPRQYGRRSRRALDDYIIDDRRVAAKVLSDMIDEIERYGNCPLADYLDMIDQPWESTDKNWGWTDLTGVRPRAVKGGYVLDLPDLEPL